MTTSELKTLIGEYDSIEIFVESGNPEEKGGYSLANIATKQRLARELVAALPAYLDSRTAEMERVVRATYSVIEAEMQQELAGASRNPALTAQGVVAAINKVQCPSLEAVLAKMEKEME